MDDQQLDDGNEHDDNNIGKPHGQEVMGLYLNSSQVFPDDDADHFEAEPNRVTVLTPSSAQTCNSQDVTDNVTSKHSTAVILRRNDNTPNDDNTGNNASANHQTTLNTSDLVSSTVVVNPEAGTVYLGQNEVVLADLLPTGGVSIPTSAQTEATFVHHSNDGNVVIATEAGSYDGSTLSMATMTHTSPTMATDAHLAALSQFSSHMHSADHVTEHEQPTLYVLSDDGASLRNDLEHRQDNVHMKKFPCDVDGCTKQFSTPYRLKAHSRCHTGEMFECDAQGCDKSFITQSDLNKHCKTHSGMKPFPCRHEGCEKVYTTAHHLKVHERTHTGIKPYKCTFPNCGKAFATGYGLKSHTRTHTGEKPYTCPSEACGKAFKTSGDLQKHIRTHTGERPFKCPYEDCNRSFTTSNIRKVHLRTHTGERPYVCEYEGCQKSFASATNYKNHTRIHTGERPYMCHVEGCDKRFTEYSSLYKHHVVHTQHKPYTCDVCSKTYRQASTLAMHKRTTHGDRDIESIVQVETGPFLSVPDEDPDMKRQRMDFTAGHTYSVVVSNDSSAVAAMQALNHGIADITHHIADTGATGHITIPVTITTDTQLQGVPVVLTETPPSTIMESGNDNELTTAEQNIAASQSNVSIVSGNLVTSGYDSMPSRFMANENVTYVYATMAPNADNQTEVTSSNEAGPEYEATSPEIHYEDDLDQNRLSGKHDKDCNSPEHITSNVISEEDFNEEQMNCSDEHKHDEVDQVTNIVFHEESEQNMTSTVI